MLLKSSIAKIRPPVGASCLDHLSQLVPNPIQVLFAAQIGRHQSQIGTGAKEKRSENWWSHNDVGNWEAPATRLSCYTTHMKAKPDDAIGKRDDADQAKSSARSHTAEDAQQSSYGKRATQQDRRIHHGIAVAALVMLVTDFQAAGDAGDRNDETEASLKAPFSQMLQD